MRIACLLALTLAGCGGAADEEQNVRAAYRAYESAFRKRDLAELRSCTSLERGKELSAPEAPQLLELAATMRPPEAAVVSSAIADRKAKLNLRGTVDGKTMTGTVSLVQEQGGWRVDKEEWTLKMTVEAPPEPPAHLPPAAMPAAVKAIVDRVASERPDAGAAAWLELGARYSGAGAFLKEVTPALGDERPAAFAIVEETFSGGGRTFRYFTAKDATAGVRQPAKTVGEALRYHLWQYEDVSNSGFKGTFAEWWPRYAGPKGLPGGAR